MPKYVGRLKDDIAFLFDEPSSAKRLDITQYFQVETLPPSPGVLKTDGVSRVWRELVPEEPEPPPELSTDQLVNILLGGDTDVQQ